MKNKAFKPSYKRFMLLSVLASAWVFFTNVPCAQAGTHGMDAVQQNRTVKGRVFDSTGEPIIGATVKVAGSQTATVTDLDGNYSPFPSRHRARGCRFPISALRHRPSPSATSRL